MIEPTGYTALDLIGFTDRGYYDPSANYVKNDLVHDDNESIWRVLIDGTSGVTPTEGLNYTIFIRNPQDAAKQMIAPVETSPTANAHAAGTQIIYHDVLYDVTTAIAAGGALVVYPTSGYNIKPAPLVTSQIQALTNQVNINTTNIVNTAQKVSGSGDEYSASNAYEIGNLCIHDNVVYRCTQNCGPASWTANQNCFEPVTLANAINNTAFVKSFYTGSLHDIVTPGIYYVAGAVTNKPTSGGGVYILGRQSIGGIAGIYISLYGSREVYSIRKIDNNWYAEQISIPDAITISGTTTASGALNIPAGYDSKPLISAYIVGTIGFALRRDAGYLTLFNNNLTPMANTEVSVKAIFLNQSI